MPFDQAKISRSSAARTGIRPSGPAQPVVDALVCAGRRTIWPATTANWSSISSWNGGPVPGTAEGTCTRSLRNYLVVTRNGDPTANEDVSSVT
jgi:hypothetical protein